MFRPLRMLRQHFNPLSLYRERRLYPVVISFFKTFQSTLPIQGETLLLLSIATALCSFQSTLPIQGETGEIQERNCNICHFNPLSLYRERQIQS